MVVFIMKAVMMMIIIIINCTVMRLEPYQVLFDLI